MSAVERDELRRLIAERAPGDALLACPCLTAAAEAQTARRPTLPSGPAPGDDFWRRRRYRGDRTRDEVVERLRARATAYAHGVRREGRCLLLLGPPASGKSVVAERLARAGGAAIVDGDDANAEIPEYAGGAGGSAVHHEAALLATYVLAALLAERTNLILPKVGGVPETSVRLVRLLASKGYAVCVGQVALSFDETIRRAASRYLDTGRIPEPAYLRDVGVRSPATFALLKEDDLVAATAVFDTSRPHHLVVRRVCGPFWPNPACAVG